MVSHKSAARLLRIDLVPRLPPLSQTAISPDRGQLAQVSAAISPIEHNVLQRQHWLLFLLFPMLVRSIGISWWVALE